MLEVLIPNQHDLKIYFGANLGQKIEICSFCLKIITNSIYTKIILTPTLVFKISNPKSIFGQIWAKKVTKLFVLPEDGHIEYGEDADSHSDINFLKTQP